MVTFEKQFLNCMFVCVVCCSCPGARYQPKNVSSIDPGKSHSTQLNCSASDMEDSLIYPNPCTSSIYNHSITSYYILPFIHPSITSTLPSTSPNFFPHHWISQTSWDPLDILRYWPLPEGWRVKNIPSVVPINHSCIGLMFHCFTLTHG